MGYELWVMGLVDMGVGFWERGEGLRFWRRKDLK
jgi:hypothetical protein